MSAAEFNSAFRAHRFYFCKRLNAQPLFTEKIASALIFLFNDYPRADDFSSCLFCNVPKGGKGTALGEKIIYYEDFVVFPEEFFRNDYVVVAPVRI